MKTGIFKAYSEVLISISRVMQPLLVLLAGLGAYYLYLPSRVGPLPLRYQIGLLTGLLLTIIVFNRFRIYKPWRGASLGEEIKALTVAWTAVVLGMVFLIFVTKTGNEFSRVWMGLWASGALMLLIWFRILVRIFLRVVRRRGWNKRHIVIAGAGKLGRQVQERLHAATWTGLEVRAFFDDNPALLGTVLGGIPVRGTVPELPAFVKAQRIDQVWIALPLRAEQQMQALINSLYQETTVDIRFVPDIFEFRLLNHSITEIAGLPVVNLTDSPMVGINQVVKAIEDRVLAALILLLTAPLSLGIILGVKLSSSGPVLYRQERMSWNGRRFQILKFRSMPVEAEAHSGPVWSPEDDPRATAFGAFLRRTGFDELPQFVNVLRGEMSIVGPRPERPVFIEKFRQEIPDYMQKHLVKAGITGWAQINGWRGDSDLEQRIKYDLFYIEHWSLWFDLKIMLLTPFKGLSARPAG